MQKKKKSTLRKIIKISAILIITLAIAVIGSGILIYNSQTLETSKLTNYTHSVDVFDYHGNLIVDDAEFKSTKIENVPDHTRWAFICTEDKHFYNHDGFSLGRIAKATFNNLSSGYAKEGASTISQQLIKNTHLSHDKTMQRKIREVALAHKLEQKFSKNQILEMYFNAIYFGNGIYGLESAAHFYFDKPVSELTLRESAGLAGIIRSPARFCPISRYDNFVSRSDLVLSLMHSQGRITQEQYNNASQEVMKITRKKVSSSGEGFYKQAAIVETANILNLSVADVSRYGYKIHTYFNPEVQEAIMNVINSGDHEIRNMAGTNADRAVIAARPNGEIVGYYISTPLIRNAKRNFASAMKPLTVYAPAIELGVVTPSTVIIDEPFTASDFNPRNHDGKYRGNVTVREALEQSYNIPAVKVMDYARLHRSVDIADNMGLNLTNDENIGIALGNTKNGTTFNEILAGYCTLASNGVKATPSIIKKITDKNGKTVYENLKTNLIAIGEDTAYIVNDMLRTGTKNGTARTLGGLPFDIAAKTGTNERENSGGTNTDIVNCSFTSDYVLLVWAGNTDMKPENDLPRGTTGGGITSFMARDIQNSISSSARDFTRPSCVGYCENGREYFSLRHKQTHDTQTQAFLKPVHPVLDGRLGDNGAPVLYFNAQGHQTYEIFKDNIAQEVVRNHSGAYTYTDKNAQKGKTYDYHVVTKLGSEEIQSNSIKIYTSADINKKSDPKKSSGKQWFF